MEIIPYKGLRQEPYQCISASVASLLGLPLWAVPRFYGSIEAVEDWVKGPLTASTGRKWRIDWHFGEAPKGFALAWGEAKKSQDGHCIVVLDGKPWHDPSDFGLSEIDGYITISIC
jgi:hypothetical protein